MGEAFAYKEYLAGLLAGVATVITGHPFDTVKVKLQIHNTEAHGIKYKNGLHCTARILQTEGVKGLYRGASSSFVGMAFESSLPFGLYSQTKQSLQHYGETEFLQCRMQIQGTDSLVPEFSIFRGGFTTLLRESIGNAVLFSVYEYVRHYMRLQLKPTLSDRSNLVDMGIGILTGGLGGVANYRRAGLKGCYTGLGLTIVRAFPANAAAIVTWELAMKMLGINRD
ncbi:hypothetical protein D5086_008071 [Populus alba]|uniref:Uncharacterized protein n=1 Tax=Populus alba TaxID=43335 RepID=A0ACC4CEM1_POPAL